MLSNFPDTEKELLSQLKEGDEKAFERIYSFYSLKIYGKLLKLTKSPATTEDLLQTIFLKLWSARQNINLEKPFGPYLFKIANNVVCDFFREAKKNLLQRENLIIRAMINYAHTEEEGYMEEKEKKLRDAIDALPPQRKIVFTLCKLNGKSYSEVSNILQVSTSTINDHIVKATRFIKESLGIFPCFWVILALASIFLIKF